MVPEQSQSTCIIVSYETIRRWGRKFGATYVKQLRRKKPSRKDIWYLVEVMISIGGQKHWLWRAVDQDGYVLDEIVQVRRDTKAAKRLLIRLLKKQGLAPKRIVTDKLRSYGAAKRERVMQGFRSAGGLQRFIAVFSAIRNHFVLPHQKRAALATHIHPIHAMAQRKAVTGAVA